MNLGVQYYRAPFPEQKYWEDDFARIKDSGFNTVQLWVLWAWVESNPGQLIFDDYDRLMELAERNGLGVILSTIAAIQPYWIHREVPGSEMVDHMGHKVISSNRCECHFGITPGGCTDHPGVWERMRRFLGEVVARYRSAPALRGWDAWNELRWNVEADGLVCFCEHTLAAFRGWLGEKYGGLDGLNSAWKRRYGSFDEVWPGKLPDRPYTEMMAFEHFLTWRANRHGKARYDLMKSLDPHHPVTVHGAAPCPLWSGDPENHALNRGNDWFYADEMDGIGCSSFPRWSGDDDADFAVRVGFVKSAARGKRVWLSEVQGGRASVGFNCFEPVDALSQQRWVWNGIACGAETVLFWCWRDEVFGRESGGFGISGADGLAEERLAAMKIAGSIIEHHKDLIASYQPAPPEVGVLFSAQSYYLCWAQEGNADRCRDALVGYLRALVRKSVPFRVVEEEHLDALSGLRILFLPRAIVVDDHTAAALEEFVRGGGTLVCESECGAFDSRGFYRYPEDRFTACLSGIREVGRRNLTGDSITARIEGRDMTLGVTQWLTPWQKGAGRVFAEDDEGPLVVEVAVGRGKVVLCGAYLGDAYLAKGGGDFEDFVELLVKGAGCRREIKVLSPRPDGDSFLYVKSGDSAGGKVVFVFFPADQDEAHLRFLPGFFSGVSLRDIISDEDVALSRSDSGRECVLQAPDWRFCVLVESRVAPAGSRP